MKRGENKCGLLLQGNSILGISLGFDFAAEHEWGIKKLKNKLGIPEEIKTWKDYLIKKNVYARHHFEEKDKTNWSFITSLDASKGVPRRVYEYIHSMPNDDFINCWWDGDDFLIIFNWNVGNTQEDLLDQLYNLFKNKRMMVAVGSIYEYLDKESFEIGGLVFVDSKKVPNKVLTQVDREIKAKENLHKNVDKSGIVDRVKAKQKEWREQYPNSMDTPWDYFALSPKETTDENTAYDFVFWLNPRHQQDLMFGWVTVEDLEDWINEKGRIIVGNWDSVKFECKSQPFYAFKYAYEEYNFHPTRHMRTWAKDQRFTGKLLKTKLDNDMVEKIEGHIKWIIKDHINLKNYHQLGYKPIGEINFQIERHERDRIFGIFETLSYFGIGAFEAINSPKTRENFAWWTDLLESEAVLELVKEYYPDEINEDWFKENK